MAPPLLRVSTEGNCPLAEQIPKCLKHKWRVIPMQQCGGPFIHGSGVPWRPRTMLL